MSRFRYPDHFVPFDEPNGDDEPIEAEIRLNPPRRTFYLGRGRHGDTNRLHRGLMFIREREWRR